MEFAHLEVRHSRPFSPTRRVALGGLYLPITGGRVGPGPLLLAGVVAAGVSALEGEDELLDKIEALLDDLDARRRVVQPRVSYRFQTDVHGLDRSRHRLLGGAGGYFRFDIDGHGAPLPQVLASMYAASKLASEGRPDAFRLLRRATRWTGGIDHHLVDFLLGDEAVGFRRRARAGELDEHWALKVLGFGAHEEPGRSDIQRRFRDLVRDAHPDHGGEHSGAGERIVELTEARRILLQTA